MRQVLISPTTCDNPDRLRDFLRTAIIMANGAPTLAAHAKPLQLQLVRLRIGGQTHYEIQVVE